VLAEFGVRLPEDVAVNIWDSTAELRYLVLPQRPGGTEGWTDDNLAKLVTRNSMIGTEREVPIPATGA
jgi:nitrile hydratase subunit alpha